MRILEQFIKGKKPDESLCEDFLFYNENFIVVADGVTAKDTILFGGETGGRVAARLICEAVAEFNLDIDAFEATRILTEKIRQLCDEYNNGGSAAASVIIYSNHHHEIWSIGDCQCIINGEVFTHSKEIDRIVSDMRALVLEMVRFEGTTDEELSENDLGREFILPVIKKQSIFANGEGRFAYGVINGAFVHEKDIVIHKVKTGDEIVLASDGYPELCGTLEESEEKLKQELTTNPLCDGDYRSTKGVQKNCTSFDDRTYIRFRVD
ncbi:MAG: hypothetical protein E7530_01025 [Ruminococcaceae bacterium]|nr:hypothetical protein [Oscillospiraceae bacterium]